MDRSNNPDPVICHVLEWAAELETIRAVLLTSTRAVPGARLDALSDYDVIVYVRNVRPFYDDRSWIDVFGEVLVAYWDPLQPAPETGDVLTGNVVQYVDGLKIDFTVSSETHLKQLADGLSLPQELDAGYLVLLDKDGLAARIPPPTHTGYRTIRPDNTRFQAIVNDFFAGVPYVAKCLIRHDMLPARWCLDYDIRFEYLLPMLTWHAASDYDWSITIGVNGKGLKRYLDSRLWQLLESSFATGTVEDTWESLFQTIALCRLAGLDVASRLGLQYPIAFDQRVTRHANAMRERGSRFR
ncbi:MAG: aminoglycoside 6-adenylyltransferase [Thermomicrobiales bacterium]